MNILSHIFKRHAAVWRLWALSLVALFSLGGLTGMAQAQGKVFNEPLEAGDLVHIFVYKNPDLTADFRIQGNGRVNLPLVGTLSLAGKTTSDAEKEVANALVSGGFLQAPQVSISMVTPRLKQAVVLGNVSKPGPVTLDYMNTHLSDVLAAVGGISAAGADDVVITGQRSGAAFRKVINVPSALSQNDPQADIVILEGDVLFVPRAPVFYAYGEVQKPGAYRLESNMTVQQALVAAGGLSKRASENRIRLQRKRSDGSVEELSGALTDTLRPDDVIFVKESLF